MALCNIYIYVSVYGVCVAGAMYVCFNVFRVMSLYMVICTITNTE